MGLKTKKILGIDITISSKKEILEEIRKYLLKIKNQKSKIKSKEIKSFIIYTPNPEIITYAQKDDNFMRIVNTAQINLPDGAGVIWALDKLYGIDITKIAGIDFMLEVVKLAEKESLTVGLIGGRQGVADETSECLVSNYPNLKIEVFEGPEIEISKIKYQKSKIQIKNQKGLKDTSGVTEWAPPMVEELERSYFTFLADEIKKKKIDILFVALGHPKQEYFIHELVRSWLLVHSERTNQLTMNPIVLMSVGGAFDYISGRVPRAPLWVRSIGLEWLFRLIREPWRFPRQLKGTEFFLRVLNSTSGLERGQK